MSEVWKSNPRKFCEFCKCWLADNKISISIHENGSRHKEAVERKINTAQKAGAKKVKQEAQAKKMFEAMERNAEAAYAKDMSEKGLPYVPSHTSSSNDDYLYEKQAPMAVDAVDWYEFKSNAGKPYYVNVKTNKTQWTKPVSGNIVSLHENIANQLDQKPPPDSKIYSSGPWDEFYTNVKDETQTDDNTRKRGRDKAYGSFQTASEPDESAIDKLGLPKVDDQARLFAHLPEEALTGIDPDEAPMKISERTISVEEYGSSLGVSSESSSGLFKKRKVNKPGRTLKQRTEDD